MQPYTFFSALPALLGLAAFVLYRVLGAHRAGDQISTRIVEKLRAGEPREFSADRRLTPKQVERLLEPQQRYRKMVGEHDFQLLKQALTQQFIVTILVYVLALGFCSWSVYLFAQSPALPKKAADSLYQSSTGKNSPNIISNGSAPVTVSIQDRTAAQPAKSEKKK